MSSVIQAQIITNPNRKVNIDGRAFRLVPRRKLTKKAGEFHPPLNLAPFKAIGFLQSQRLACQDEPSKESAKQQLIGFSSSAVTEKTGYALLSGGDG